jgi:hypothetical protein
MAVTLRQLGLIDPGGGRIRAPHEAAPADRAPQDVERIRGIQDAVA